MNNLAQDWVSWLWVVKVLIILFGLIWIFYDVLKLFRQDGVPERELRIILRIGLKIICLFIIFVALFSFFGPGKPDELPSIDVDGHRRIVEKRSDPPLESTIREEAITKKDPYLKAVEANSKDVSDDANEYVKRALERSKQ